MEKISLTTIILGILLIAPTFSLGIAAPKQMIEQPIQIDTGANPLSLTFLSPNTNLQRNKFSDLIFSILQKFDSNATHVSAGWTDIIPRTFGYPATSGIPTYQNGGYDLFAVGLSTSPNYNPAYSYNSSHLSPAGNNFAWYQNATMDQLTSSYASDLNPTTRSTTASLIQHNAHDDLPYIPIIQAQQLQLYSGNLLYQNPQIIKHYTSGSDTFRNLGHISNQTITIATMNYLGDLSPFLYSIYSPQEFLTPMLPGLYEFYNTSINFGYKPVLALGEPIMNAQGTELTVHLNITAKFSNGNPVTAWDVVNSYRMHMNVNVSSNLNADLSYYLNSSMGYNAVQMVDNSTVNFYFNRPTFDNFEMLTAGIMDDVGIGNYTTYTNQDFNNITAFSSTIIGAGPYEFNSIDSSLNNLKLTAVPNWWGGNVDASTVIFKTMSKDTALKELSNDNVHIIDQSYNFNFTEIQNYPSIRYNVLNPSLVQMLVFNMQHPILGTGVGTPLGQVNPSEAGHAANYVRKAIAYLIPYKKIRDDIYGGLGRVSNSLWDISDRYYDHSILPYHYSIEQAIHYFELAGYSMKDLEPIFLDFKMSFNSNNNSYTMLVKIADVDSSVTQVEVEIDLGTGTPIMYAMYKLNDTFWYETLPYRNCEFSQLVNVSYRVYIFDISGNSFTKWTNFNLPVPVIYDLVNPELNSTKIVEYFSTDQIIVKFNAFDKNPGYFDVYLGDIFYDSVNTWVNGTNEYNLGTLGASNYSVRIIVYDQYSNFNSTDLVVVVKDNPTTASTSTSSSTSTPSPSETQTNQTQSMETPSISLPGFGFSLVIFSMIVIITTRRKFFLKT